MSRTRIWGFTTLVVATGLAAVWVFTQRATPPALDQVTATLRSGALQFETGTRLLSRQVRDVAAVAARDPSLAAVLAPPDGPPPPRPPPAQRSAASPAPAAVDPGAAADAAVSAAAALLDVELGRAPLVGFAHERDVSLRVGERHVAPVDPLARALLGSGAAPRHVRFEDALYAVAVIHSDRGFTLAFGLPVDPRWTGRLQAATGADLTLVGPQLVSTLSAVDAARVVAAAGRPTAEAVDVGRLGAISVAPGLPALPLLFRKAPAFRARALGLPGIEGPVAVLSAPVRPSLEPVAAVQQAMLAVILLLGVVGAVLGMPRERVVPSHVPRELAAAADRISRGDFDARVPRMSGTFGTLASALSRASEAARLARIGQGATGGATPPATPEPMPVAPPVAPPPHPPVPAPTLDVPLHAVAPEEASHAHEAEAPGPSGLYPPATPTPLPLEARPAGSATAAALVQAAQRARAGQPRTTQPVGGNGFATPAPGRATPPSVEDLDAAWRGVYEEFLRVRVGQGEPVEGVTWERFREKLRKNRELLVQKYACRTVRFQVHVKDGKAALRATPVR